MAAVPPTVGDFFTVQADRLGSEPSDVSLIRTPGKNEVQLLWRQQYANLVAEMGYSTRVDKVLSGPAGAGKSCMLYALAQYAVERGWLVLYVGDAARLASMFAIETAQTLLKYLQTTNRERWPAEYPPLDTAGFTSEQVLYRAEEAIQAMRSRDNWPCLVAVDQWNVVRDATTSDYFRRLFGRFDVLRVTRGATLLAVSSSFSPPLGLFRDADAITHRQPVDLYSPQELSLIADHMRQRGELPAANHGFDVDAIERICGRVGRMLAFAKLTWGTVQHPDGRWTQGHTSTLNELASDYYTNRVRSLLTRATNDAVNQNERRALLRYAASLFLNKHTAAAVRDDMPPAFRWAGFFDMTVFPVLPVCPAVTVGINRALCDATLDVLQFLAENPNTRGTALELFVERGFRTIQPAFLTLRTTNIHGDRTPDLALTINTVRLQDENDPAAALVNIVDGTLIVCFPGHGVVDMVLYCSGIVYFIQISMLSYMRYDKIEHLDTTQVRGTGETVGHFYTHRAPANWNVPVYNGRFTAAVQAKVKYVYITPDTTAHRIVAADPSRHVLRVGGNDLNVFGDDAKLFVR